MMRFLSILLLIFCLTAPYSHCQICLSDTKLFAVREGLSQSHITCILQDSRGYLWVGTENGLNRYDGYSFVNYTHQPFDTTSLSDNYINAITEGPDGRLWIATNKGLNAFDPLNEQIIRYYYSPRNINTISDNVVLNIYFDPHKTLWVKTQKSLDKFDSQNQSFKRFPHFYDVFRYVSGNIPFPIIEDKGGRLWVGSKDGLNFFDKDLQLYHRYVSMANNQQCVSHNEIRTIFEDKNNTLWIGTTNGLNAFDPDLKTFKRYYIDNSQAVKINAIYGEGSILWIGTSNGLYQFNTISSTFTKVWISASESFNLPIYSIFKDNSGVLWIGTIKGLLKINSKRPNFQKLKIESSENAFSSNNINAIYADNSDNLWIGSCTLGVNVLNLKSKSIYRLLMNKEISNETNFIHSIFKYDDSHFWIGTNDGILTYNTETNKTNSLCKELPIPGCESFLQNKVNIISKDSKGQIWIGTLHGLFLFNPSTLSLKTFLNNPDNTNTLCNNTINCIRPDSKNNVWIGTESGLDYLDVEKEKFTHYSETLNTKPFLSNTNINSIQIDKSGNLWVGTCAGMNFIDLHTHTSKVWTEKDGLSDNMICSVILDKKQNVWLSTRHGINMIDPKTQLVKIFDLFDGLQDYEFNINSSCQNNKGEIFFGGVAGINSFHPDSIRTSQFNPPVVITSVEIITPNGKVERVSPHSAEIEIPFKTPIFTINFASLDFSVPEKNHFSYKFYSNQENDWVYLKNKHSQTFSNLKPGTYHFKLKATNSDLVWSNNELDYTIVINAPFWLSTKAYYVYAFILIILGIAFYRYRTFHLRAANKLLKDKERSAREIERQKELLAIKNKNITDSINYAKRIQQALMPSEKAFKKILPLSFVLHQPKDIVSGDFFWISERSDKIFVAAADCTGHGVPGAFMSIIGFELFRKITHNRGIEDPSEILNILNQEFEEIFKDVDDNIKDGMDIAFCVIDKKTRILEFAGAVNPIYLVRDNKITEIRGSRFSVGIDDSKEDQSFENKQIILLPDDVIYLFSDGYADQFGGPEGKKFKYRRFRHLLLTIHQYPIEKQHQLLEERINQWKGNLEQVDDILVIGFKPDFKID